MQLEFTPDGVCFNCLNNAHKLCTRAACKCRIRRHRQWWFREDGIKDEHQALVKDGHIKEAMTEA